MPSQNNAQGYLCMFLRSVLVHARELTALIVRKKRLVYVTDEKGLLKYSSRFRIWYPHIEGAFCRRNKKSKRCVCIQQLSALPLFRSGPLTRRIPVWFLFKKHKKRFLGFSTCAVSADTFSDSQRTIEDSDIATSLLQTVGIRPTNTIRLLLVEKNLWKIPGLTGFLVTVRYMRKSRLSVFLKMVKDWAKRNISHAECFQYKDFHKPSNTYTI